MLPQLLSSGRWNLGWASQAQMVLDKALRPLNDAFWGFEDLELQEVWWMAQDGVIRVLRIHVQVRNEFCGSSMDKVTVVAGLDHGIHQ